MDDPSDAELMERIRAGDRDALESLLQRHADRIFGFGMRVCRDRDDAEEVLQETMLAVARAAPTWRGDGAVPTWLYAIARNACARRRRRRAGAPNHLEPLDACAEVPADERGAVPDVAVERARMREALESAIDELPDEMREVVILRDVEGLRAKEVAEALGISVPAVKSRLHRARARLRDVLRPVDEPRAGCPDVVQALSESLEGDLDRAACATLEAHVAGCDWCRGRCDGLRDVLALCAESPTPHVPEPVRQATLAALRDALDR